jgi:hypothetical protein
MRLEIEVDDFHGVVMVVGEKIVGVERIAGALVLEHS